MAPAHETTNILLKQKMNEQLSESIRCHKDITE